MRNFFAVVMLWVTFVVGLEVSVRTFRPMPPLLTEGDIGWNASGSPYRTSPRADRNFVNHMSLEVNQLALRGRPFVAKSADKINVLLVGDSQIEATTLPFGEIPEVQLEHVLNGRLGGHSFDVRSIAASGWGQDQQLLALRRYYERFSADYILLWLTPRNDFWENAFPDRSTDPIDPFSARLKPTFFLNDAKLTPFDFGVYTHARSRVNALHLYRLPFRALERFGLSGKVKLFRDWERLVPGPEGHLPVPREECPATVVEQEAYARDRALYGRTPVSIESSEAFLESRSSFSPFLDPPSERDKYLMRITHALLEEISRLAESHRTHFLVFFNNQHYRDGDSDSARPGTCVGHQGKWYTVADMPKVVRAVVEGVRAVELTSRHPDTSLDEVSVSRTDRHLNRLGNQLVFEELVGVLQKNGWLEGRER